MRNVSHETIISCYDDVTAVLLRDLADPPLAEKTMRVGDVSSVAEKIVPVRLNEESDNETTTAVVYVLLLHSVGHEIT